MKTGLLNSYKIYQKLIWIVLNKPLLIRAGL